MDKKKLRKIVHETNLNFVAIYAFGNHETNEQLLSLNGEYKNLYDRQFKK